MANLLQTGKVLSLLEKQLEQRGITPTKAEEAHQKRVLRLAREGNQVHELADESAKRTRTRLLDSGFPARFAELSLDQLDPVSTVDPKGHAAMINTARAFVQAWDKVSAKGTILTMLGTPGTGKTTLACSMANSLVFSQRISVAYITMPGYLRRLRSSFGRSSRETEQQVFESVAKTDLLVIDEVGRFQTDESKARENLFELLDTRFRDLRPTIVIANHTHDELMNFIGPAGMSRLEASVNRIMPLAWEDLRQKGF